KSFYNLEQKLLQPIFTIYPWSPDLSSSLNDDERNLLEQALFSCTAQTVGGPGQPSGADKSPHPLSSSTRPTRLHPIQTDPRIGLVRVVIGWMVFIGLFDLVAFIRFCIWVGPVLRQAVEAAGDQGMSIRYEFLILGTILVVICLTSIKFLGNAASNTFTNVGQ